MLSLDDRARVVFTEAWHLLPPLKEAIVIDDIVLENLHAKHGSYDPDTQTLTLSTRLFMGDVQEIPLIDVDGQDPPLTLPCVSRALHTTLHEIAHALGAATGLDSTPTWLRLSTWAEASDDPQGTARYWECRPGWPYGPSSWRHRTGCWFVREYSRKSPHEDFADGVTHVALGWTDAFGTSANGSAKLAYMRQHVWQETGVSAMTAACRRWQKRLMDMAYA